MRRFGLVAVVYVALLLLLVVFIRPLRLPDEAAGLAVSAGPINSVLQEVTGKRTPTDFLADYASVRALKDGVDPYLTAEALIDRSGGPSWPVSHANSHPPTVLTLILPFSLLSYQNALAAWSLLMIFALIWTVNLSGVALRYAIPIGLAVSITFPGAYGIGNVVPLIGLGIAVAYRYRDNPLLAAAGLTLAAAPKISGLILVVPFFFMQRWKAVAWTAAFMTVLSVIPLIFFTRIWGRYLDRGVFAIKVNAERSDNASLLKLFDGVGIPSAVTVALLVLATAALAWRIRDWFWPAVWLIVAALPILWMYSVLTLLPLMCVSVRRRTPVAVGSVALIAALTVGTAPSGQWPVRIVPIIIALAVVALSEIEEDAFWPSKESLSGLVARALRRPVAVGNQ